MRSYLNKKLIVLEKKILKKFKNQKKKWSFCKNINKLFNLFKFKNRKIIINKKF